MPTDLEAGQAPSRRRRDVGREREGLKRERRRRRPPDRDRHPERDRRSDRKKKKRSRDDDDSPRKRRRTESASAPPLAAYAPPPSYQDQRQSASFRQGCASLAAAAYAPPPSSSQQGQQAPRRFAQPAPSLASPPSPPRKFGGHEQANYLTCAVCGTACSGEESFKEHIASRKHLKKSRGRGFAGLSPNAAGAVPAMRDPELRRAASEFGHDPDRSVAPSVQSSVQQPGHARREGGGAKPSGPWAPPTAFVRVSPDARLRAKAAVDSMWFDVDPDHDGGDDFRRDRQRTRNAAKVPDRAAGDPLGDVRRSLPVFEHRTGLLEALASLTADSPCLVVEGETGSGKSTQVPQYILEEAHQQGKAVDVLVTQPRRIAAIGVADRIAAERGERCGDSVGYAIKGEARLGPRTALTLCTTGVALRRLQGDGLEGVTHVVVDEVHERSLESDFLLLALAQLLKTRRDLRIVLMSATMPGPAVREYFGRGCPTVRFPGRAFPVHALYLEEALAVTGHVVRNGADWHRASQKSERIQKRLADAERNGGPNDLQLLPRDPAECRRRGLPDACSSMEENILNVDLVCDLVEWFSLKCGGDVDAAVADAARRPPRQGTTATPVATLVFCAGVQDIDDVLAALGRSGRFDPDWLRPLHGALPPDDQRRVFEVPPPGVCKVVVATNVAETSITIPDVGFVVDACRVKEQRYDPQRHMASLDDVYVSRSSAKQRRGRAGRVRDGLCVSLFGFACLSCHTALL